MENPEQVEKLLALRRQTTMQTKLPPPDRSGLVGLLKHPHLASVVTGWCEITEARALAWLDYNLHNRKMNTGKVNAYARQHRNGDFADTHQGIAFCVDAATGGEQLCDGQHTLKMVLVTGKRVWRMVTFGLPKKPAGKAFDTMDVIDAGARSAADQLAIGHGVKDSGTVKQVCAALATLCLGKRARNLAVPDVLAVLQEFEPHVTRIVAQRSKEKGLRQAGVLAGFVFAAAAEYGVGRPESRVGKWFGELTSGAGLADEAAYLALRKKGRPCRPLEHLRAYLVSPESELFSRAMNQTMAEVTLQVLYGEAHGVKTQALESVAVGAKWFAAKQKARAGKVAALFALPVQSPESRVQSLKGTGN